VGVGGQFITGAQIVSNDELVFRVVDALTQVSSQTGKSVAQVAINWVLHRPSVSTVIIGARNEEQLRDNLEVVQWKLSAEQIALLDAASAVPIVYPYWHQRGFQQRIPVPV
jgi:aryl-alcohol dehydrogenase-like predicted oxidoreductase